MSGTKKITIARPEDYEIEVIRDGDDLHIVQATSDDRQVVIMPIADAMRLIAAIAQVHEYGE